MGFVCKYCGYLNEVKPQYSEEQNKKYLNLEKKVEKLKLELKGINEDCTEELERRKAKRKKFFICIGIGVGIYILGWVLVELKVSFVLAVSLLAVGIGVAVLGCMGYPFRVNFERIFKEKYPKMAESKDFQIRSKKVEVSGEYFIEKLKQKWNCSFICLFCGKENRFWKES